MRGPIRIHERAPIGPTATLLAALLLLGSLACGAPRESPVNLASRRDAEFADLSTQAGMVTPSYSHPLELARAEHARLAQEAAQAPTNAPSSPSR